MCGVSSGRRVSAGRVSEEMGGTMTALICDRCERVFGGVTLELVTRVRNTNVPVNRDDDYRPDRKELCPTCSKALQCWLQPEVEHPEVENDEEVE